MISEPIDTAENEADENQAHVFEPPPDWDGIPRAYLHVDCGTVTQVSDDIIRNYLADPYFYSAGDTICASCGIALDKDCVWTETGERVDHYMEKLKAKKDINYHLVRWGLPFVFGTIGAVVLPMIPGKLQVGPGVVALLGFVMGLLPGFYLARFPRLLLCKLGII